MSYWNPVQLWFRRLRTATWSVPDVFHHVYDQTKHKSRMGLFSCLLAFLATLYLWLTFWVSHLAVLALQLVLAVVFSWLYVCSPNWYLKILGLAHYFTIFPLISLNPFWWVRRVRSVGESRKIDLPRGSMLMSNHLSYVDSWIVASKLVPRSLTFVAMEAIFKMPVLGQVLRLAGHIPVQFYKDKETKKYKVKNRELLIERSERALRRGRRLVVFPEGKLSVDGELNPFKIGFFKTAVSTGSPILPAAMWGNHTLFPPGDQYAAAHPGIVDIKFGDLISPLENETAEELRDRVKESIEALLEQIPSRQRWVAKKDKNNSIDNQA